MSSQDNNVVSCKSIGQLITICVKIMNVINSQELLYCLSCKLEKSMLCQEEICRLREKLAISERTAKAEAQLKVCTVSFNKRKKNSN